MHEASFLEFCCLGRHFYLLSIIKNVWDLVSISHRELSAMYAWQNARSQLHKNAVFPSNNYQMIIYPTYQQVVYF